MGFLVAVSVAAAVTPTARASAAVAATVPSGIPADCSRNVTADLQAWIDSVPDGSTLTFAPLGCYRIDGTLVLKNRTGLTSEGNNSTFRAVTDGSELVRANSVRTRNLWSFLGSRDLMVRNVISVGANPHAGRGELAYAPKFEAQHAYLTMGTTNITLDHVQAYDVYGDFVWVGPGTNHLTVRNSTFSRNGRQGWTINGSDILFENNSISETRRATIDMEPSLPTWGAHNIMIRNNTIGKGRLLFFASVGAAAPIDNVSIIGNRFYGKPMTIYVAPPKGTRSNYRVINNVSDAAVSGFGAPLVFRHVNGVEIRGNVQPTQWSHHLSGVSIFASSNVVIADNVFRAAKAVFIDRGLNTNVRQWNNMIGPLPMIMAAPETVVGPTALQIR